MHCVTFNETIYIIILNGISIWIDSESISNAPEWKMETFSHVDFQSTIRWACAFTHIPPSIDCEWNEWNWSTWQFRVDGAGVWSLIKDTNHMRMCKTQKPIFKRIKRVNIWWLITALIMVVSIQNIVLYSLMAWSGHFWDCANTKYYYCVHVSSGGYATALHSKFNNLSSRVRSSACVWCAVKIEWYPFIQYN